ncbi:DUF1670 domain-containing protein, partial [Halarsenatibacter silvermanii]
IARKTNHSQQAVDRYIKDYERVKFLVRRGIEPARIQHMTGRSQTVIEQYIEIIEHYHLEHVKDEKEG